MHTLILVCTQEDTWWQFLSAWGKSSVFALLDVTFSNSDKNL